MSPEAHYWVELTKCRYWRNINAFFALFNLVALVDESFTTRTPLWGLLYLVLFAWGAAAAYQCQVWMDQQTASGPPRNE